jgi:hypothetical protein
MYHEDDSKALELAKIEIERLQDQLHHAMKAINHLTDLLRTSQEARIFRDV